LWVYQAYDVTNVKSASTNIIELLQKIEPRIAVSHLDFARAKRVNGKNAQYTEQDLMPERGAFSAVYVSHSAPWPPNKKDPAPAGYKSYVSFGKPVGGKSIETNLYMMEYGRFVDILADSRAKILFLAFCQSAHIASDLLENRAGEFIVFFGDETEGGNDGVSAFFMSEFTRLFFKQLSGLGRHPLHAAVFGAFEHAYLELGRDYHGPSTVRLPNGEYVYSNMTTNKTFNEERSKREAGHIVGYHFEGKVWLCCRQALPWTLDEMEARRRASMATWQAPA
jgi:hypothetical protein